MAMSEKQKMLAGGLYYPGDPEILADQAAAKAWMVRYNAALAASPDERRALLAERLMPPVLGDKGEVITEFDPTAEKLILAPPVVGG